MTTKSRTSISEIAQKLKLSPSTVSRALNDSPHISETTKKKVREIANEYNYVPNHSAKNLKSGQSKTIAVIVPTIARYFFSSTIESIEDYASANGYDVLICQHKDSYAIENKIVKNMEGRVDGIIASIAAHGLDYNYYKNLSIPLVLFDRSSDELPSASVTVDDAHGGYIATKHLIEQGVRKIYNHTGAQHTSVWRNRHLGYLKAMNEAGIKVEPNWIWEASTTIDEGRKFAQAILSGKLEMPEAIFLNGDYAAIGALKEFEKNNVSIPIVGYSNESLCELITPSLTSVNQFCGQIGIQSCKLLLDIIAGNPTSKNIITPQLIVRNSSIIK